MADKPPPTRRALFAAALPWSIAAAAIAAAAPGASRIDFDSLYKSFGVTGYVFSDRLVGLKGQDVSILGYLAPPLKAESRFFVLTREPLALCPFCQSDADWPVDIVVAYLRQSATMPPAGAQLLVEGRLELGSWNDPETGFVSQLRITDARFRKA